MNSKNFYPNVNTQVDIQIDETSIQQQNLNKLMEKVSKIFQSMKLGKRFQKIYFYSIQFLPDHLKIKSLTNQLSFHSQKRTIYLKIQQKQKKREFQKNELIFLSKHQENLYDEINQKQKLQNLSKYLLTTLQYIQCIFQLCQQFSQGQEIVYKNLLSKCSRFIINQHQNLCINLLLKDLIQPVGKLDPFLLKAKIKKQNQLQITDIFNWNSQIRDRMIKVTEQIIRVTNNHKEKKQFKINISGLNNVLKKYSLGDSQRTSQQQNNVQNSKKFSLNNQNSQKTNQQNNNNINLQKRIFLNFRKNKLRKNLAKSVDTKNIQINKPEKLTFSTRKVLQKQWQKNPKNIKQDKQSKTKNLRTVLLQPLQGKIQRSKLSIRSENSAKSLNTQIKRTQLLSIRKRKYRKLSQLQYPKQVPNQIQNNQHDLSNNDKNQNIESKNQIITSRKLLSPIMKHKYQKFKTQQDKNLQILESTLKNVFTRKNSQKIYVKKNSNFSHQFILLKEIIDPQRENQSKDPQFLQNSLVNTNSQNLKIQGQINSLIQEKNNIKNSEEFEKQNVDKNFDLIQNQKLSQEALNFQQQRPAQLPLPSCCNQKEINNNKNDMQVQKVQQDIRQKERTIQEKSEKEKKKILLKAPKLRWQQINAYFQRVNVSVEEDLLSEMQEHQHYINQFYLNKKLFCVIVFSESFDLKHLQIKLIHQMKNENSCQQLDLQIRHKLRKLMIKNYIDVLSKSCTNLQQVIFKSQNNLYPWLIQCAFTFDGSNHIYNFNNQKVIQQSTLKQFLSLNLSILKVKQSLNQTFLYSDEISPFKAGKYDINQNIFSNTNFHLLSSDFNGQFLNIHDVNQLLETKEFDTFESNPNFQTLIQSEKNNLDNKIILNIFTFHQLINTKFIVSNGWIQTISYLVFRQKNQIICQFTLQNNYELYFGRGFQHIGTMKNKITHYKTKLSLSKNQNKTKQMITKIRMFSKQLYGLIKHEDNMAFYGNWEMNFHFKHQFMGKINIQINTQNQEKDLVFGNQTFFVNIYCGDQFLIGWEVQDNDFLY